MTALKNLGELAKTLNGKVTMVKERSAKGDISHPELFIKTYGRERIVILEWLRKLRFKAGRKAPVIIIKEYTDGKSYAVIDVEDLQEILK